MDRKLPGGHLWLVHVASCQGDAPQTQLALFAAHGLLVNDIGIIKAVYPLTWSIGQLATGALADAVTAVLLLALPTV